MKLSLSVRIAESFSSKETATLSIDEIIDIARANHFDALCMRASQVGIHSPPEEITAARRKIEAAGLTVSMVTADFAVPRNDQHGPEALRNITPSLDLAVTLGADLIRVCMMHDDDIPWAQRAADEARECGIRLAHQSHCASLFETVEESRRVLEAIDRPNFGLIYEPANWMISHQDYVTAIHTLAPWILNVYVQNHRLDPDGSDSVNTWGQGRVRLEHIGLWEEGGVDYEAVIAALRDSDHNGYVTVHQAFAGIMEPADAARRSRDYLMTLLSR